MEEYRYIFIVAPLIFGSVIGLITFYFMRLYREYTAQNLLKNGLCFYWRCRNLFDIIHC